MMQLCSWQSVKLHSPSIDGLSQVADGLLMFEVMVILGVIMVTLFPGESEAEEGRCKFGLLVVKKVQTWSFAAASPWIL